MIFSLLYLKLEPKLSILKNDNSENRLSKICNLMNESKYSIHDISMMKSNSASEFFRLNMSFELGIDYGIKIYGSSEHSSQKMFLILEGEKYQYRRAISDISGWDIECHDNNAQKLIRIIRDWFIANKATEFAGTPAKIYEDYVYLCSYVWDQMVDKGKKGVSRNRMPFNEYINFADKWIKKKIR